ncbi:hypothetical protein LCGC14_0712560 [marine sediment metagenome]|uniref:Uncharacterized protein n=1 Tax=marine sediment metagenome TaxID=412755 RepID=A0A0F9QEL6_9ZZZZ
MAMDREDFRDEVRGNIKRTVDGVSNARINRWINWAQGYLSDLHTYEEMRSNDTSKSTTASSVVVTWPTRMKDLYSMTVRDGARSRKLVYVHARNFDREVPRPATYTEGLPSWYVDYGSTFELFQIPDAIYNLAIRCSVYPADFGDDDATSTLLRKDALISGVATVFGFYSLREVEDAAYWGSQIVPPLYEASLTSDHSAEDWLPIARGFQSQPLNMAGQWWTNPFTGRIVPGY